MLIQIIAAIALICIAALLFFGTSRSPQQSTNCTYCKYFDVKTQKCTNKESYFYSCARNESDSPCEKWRYFYDGRTTAFYS